MLFKNSSCKNKNNFKTKLGFMLLGVMVGGAGATVLCCKNKLMKKKKNLISSICDCGCMENLMPKKHKGCETDNTYENFSECDCEPDDTCGAYGYENARNGYYAHCDSKKCDIEGLDSSGCLGYPHDDYCGFASSHDDRPNDLSNPEIDNQMGIPEGNSTPMSAKNEPKKFNPQPENAITDENSKKKK